MWWKIIFAVYLHTKSFSICFSGKKWNLAWSSQINIIDIVKRRKCRKTNNIYYALSKINVGDTTNNLLGNYVKTIITYRRNTIMPLIDFQCCHGVEGKCRRVFLVFFESHNTLATTEFFIIMKCARCNEYKSRSNQQMGIISSCIVKVIYTLIEFSYNTKLLQSSKLWF